MKSSPTAAAARADANRLTIENSLSLTDADATMLAVHLWTALHGIVTLRAVRPAFPWPDLAVEIDSLIAHLIADLR